MDRENYILCYHNGKKHIDLGITLGEKQDYGTAISFFILGLEELVKYIVIQMASGERNLFTDKELNFLFSSHTGKHKILIEYLEATKLDFGENYMLSVFNKLIVRPLNEEQETLQLNRFKGLGTMIGVVEQNLTGEEIDSFILWLKNDADNFKNRGLYVNKEDRSKDILNSKLISPSAIEENEYILILKFANSFLSQATFLKDIDLTDDEFTDFMNSPM